MLEKIKAEHEERMEEAKRKLPAGGGGGGGGQHSESKESAGKSSSSTSSSGTSGSSTSITTVINGETTSVTRTSGPDGREKITVTTKRAGGKPKVRQLTPGEFEKEFGDKFGKKKGAAPGKIEPAPAPSIPLPNTKPNSSAATE
jgi:hypothetical protein